MAGCRLWIPDHTRNIFMRHWIKIIKLVCVLESKFWIFFSKSYKVFRMFRMLLIKKEPNSSCYDLSLVFDGIELFLFLPIKPKISLYTLNHPWQTQIYLNLCDWICWILDVFCRLTSHICTRVYYPQSCFLSTFVLLIYNVPWYYSLHPKTTVE